MVQYELMLALDGAALHISANAPAMNDLVFEKLVGEYNNVQKLITRLSRYYPEPLLQGLVYQPQLTVELMRNESAVENWANAFVAYLTEKKQKRIYIQRELNLTANAKYMKQSLLFVNMVLISITSSTLIL